MKVRLFVPKNGDLAYTEIPKCACSTIKQYLNAVGCGSFHDGDIHRVHPGLLRWRHDPLRILGRLMRRRHHHFTCVRNPYARVVSAFYDKVMNPQADGRMYGNAALRAAIRARGVEPDVDPIVAFRRFVVLVRDSVVFADPVEADIHWLPMAWHAASAMRPSFAYEFGYDAILHVESLVADLPALLAERAPGRFADEAGLRVFNDSAGGGVRRTASVAAHFDATSRLLMQEAFYDDFVTFGYSTDPDVVEARPMELAEINRRLAQVRMRMPKGGMRQRLRRLRGGGAKRETRVLPADLGIVDLGAAHG